MIDFKREKDEMGLKERLRVLGGFYSNIIGIKGARDSSLRGISMSGMWVLIETVNEKLLLSVS
jgi:hypothetical protein